MTKHKKFKFKKQLKAFKEYLISDEKIQWRKAITVYIVFIVFMLALEAIFHLLPIELIKISEKKLEDIDLTDIHYVVNPFPHNHKDVVLINIGDQNIHEIRTLMPILIDSLLKFKPKKIGIDIRFDGKANSAFYPSPDITDSKLIAIFNKHKDIIVLAKNHQDVLFSNPSIKEKVTIGNVNIFAQENKTVREYSAYNKINEKDSIQLSFANALVDNTLVCKKDSIYFLKYSTTERGYYNYFEKNPLIDSTEVDFPAIESKLLIENEVPNNELYNLIKNKIVIIGLLGHGTMNFNPNDIEDKFIVPNNSNLVYREKTMPGSAVHANAVQMLLNQKKNIENFHDIKGYLFKCILFSILFLYFIVFLLSEKIKPILLKFIIEMIIVIIMTFLFIKLSIKLMDFGYHLNLSLLIIYLPVLVEFKLFLSELYKSFDKIFLPLKKIKKTCQQKIHSFFRFS